MKITFSTKILLLLENVCCFNISCNTIQDLHGTHFGAAPDCLMGMSRMRIIYPRSSALTCRQPEAGSIE